MSCSPCNTHTTKLLADGYHRKIKIAFMNFFCFDLERIRGPWKHRCKMTSLAKKPKLQHGSAQCLPFLEWNSMQNKKKAWHFFFQKDDLRMKKCWPRFCSNDACRCYVFYTYSLYLFHSGWEDAMKISSVLGILTVAVVWWDTWNYKCNKTIMSD